MDELGLAMRLQEGTDRDTMIRNLTARMDALNANNTNEDKKAVRLDIQFKSGEDELLVDCSITHSLSKSHVRAEAKRTWQRLLAHRRRTRQASSSIRDSTQC